MFSPQLPTPHVPPGQLPLQIPSSFPPLAGLPLSPGPLPPPSVRPMGPSSWLPDVEQLLSSLQPGQLPLTVGSGGAAAGIAMGGGEEDGWDDASTSGSEATAPLPTTVHSFSIARKALLLRSRSFPLCSEEDYVALPRSH